MKVKTRFAPSPTGSLHIGGVRTALFSWLYAKQNNGEFVLRIEDTDRERSTQESVDVILEGMAWLGLSADEEPIYQSQRFDRYNEIIDQLLEQGDAYHCDCSRERLDTVRQEQQARKEKPKYDGCCRQRTDVNLNEPHVIRFKNPIDGSVKFDDIIKGSIEIANRELDDLIIRRSDGSPTYNLTVVVDDWDMDISHVIRGDDHINNTPRQINLLKALKAHIPFYAHLPMILGDDSKRLSKRHGATGVLQYDLDGFLPEALLNYLVRLGWSHQDQEIFSVKEMVKLFSLEQVNKSPSIFNPDKLLWINQEYIKMQNDSRLAELVKPFIKMLGIDLNRGPELEPVIQLQKERAKTLKDLAEVCAFFYGTIAEYEKKAAKKNLKTKAKKGLQALYKEFESSAWTQEGIKKSIEGVVERQQLSFGQVALPLRVAITGGAPSPGIDETAFLIGRDQVRKRILNAIIFIDQSNPETPN